LKPERIGEGVKQELGRFGPAAGMAELVGAWPSLVGEQIARNAWPARFARDGTLHVATSSSAWAFELTQLAPQLLARVQEALGGAAPQAIRFAPGKLPDDPGPAVEERTQRVAEPSPEDVKRAFELAAPIEDETLREVVAKTAARSLARASDDRSFW
jgi:predicted nucleic acid-binding Zn ribbon protein